MSKYIKAYEAGVKAGEVARAGKQYSPEDWKDHFLDYMASIEVGFETMYRQFAKGFDPANIRRTEGDDD
jgi:hypothetical protein